MLSKTTENYTTTYEEKSRDTRLLGSITITQGLDIVPTVSMKIPIDSLPMENGLIVKNYSNYRVLIQITEDNKPKYGFACIVDSISLDYAEMTAELNLSHRMAEMRDWLMPANLSIKNMLLGYCVENVCRLGFPDDYVKDDQVLIDINYLSQPSTTVPHTRNTPTNHVQQNVSGTDTSNLIYVDTEIPVVIDMDEESYNKRLEMTFASNNKLAALSEIVSNTDNVHFVGTISSHEMYYPPTSGTFGDGVKISTFNEPVDNSIIIAQSPDSVTENECDNNNSDLHIIPLLSDPTISTDYTNHFNRAVVFCGDVGDGVMHLTLKEVYNDINIQNAMGVGSDGKPLFPVGMYKRNVNLAPEAEYDENGTKINNEKIYQDYEMPEVANNDNREYYVTDREQLAKDNGLVKHTVYNFSDLYPIPDLEKSVRDSQGNTTKIEMEITNDDRIEITKRAYWRAVRYLKSQRPTPVYTFNSGSLPNIDLIGKKVRFRYAAQVTYPDDTEMQSHEAECHDTKSQMIDFIDEEYYITNRIVTFDNDLNEYSTVTLDKELRPNPVEEIAIELHEKASGDDTEGNTEFGKIYPDVSEVGYNSDLGVWI